MTIENKPVKLGDTLFFINVTTQGTRKQKNGTVIDMNEHVKAVKIRYIKNLDKETPENNTKSVWLPASVLSWVPQIKV